MDDAERLLTKADDAGVAPDWFREPKHHNMYAAIQAAWRRFHALDVFQIKDCTTLWREATRGMAT